MQRTDMVTLGRLVFFFIWALSCPLLLSSQTSLVLGQQRNIGPGSPSDYIIPAMAGDVTVTLRGGDGGGVRFSGLICETTVEGGSGATINATFEVGFAPGQLKPGGRIRAMVGQKGESDSKACGSGAASYAGGGGSSAILYLPPNADATGMNWQLLAVAGAGGGAARPSSGIDRTGRGATARDPSGSVNGIAGAYGGYNGNFGTGNSFIDEAHPGAGYLGGNRIPGWAGAQRRYCSSDFPNNCDFWMYSMVRSADPNTTPIRVQLMDNAYFDYTGDSNPLNPANYLYGGDGFTGGGAGSTNAVFGEGGTAGGGGGGYSGGSGNYYFGGGGGSSHLASGVNTSSVNISPGSNGASGHNDGFIRLTANAAPVITQANCQNQTVQLNANGQASFNASQLNNGSTGFAPLSYTINGQSTLNFTCADVGTRGVIMTLTDVYGSPSTCSATITIEDNVGPTATCQDVTVQLNAMGNGMISTCSVDSGSADACGGFVGYAVSQTAFTCNDIGTSPITLTVTDVNGNANTCTANVTVQDNTRPIAVCQDVTVQLDANGNATASAAAVNDGSSDTCGSLSFSLDKTNFTCSDIGPNAVILTVGDGYDNASTCSATVTVEDNVAPVALCKDINIYLEGDGDVLISPADIDNGSSAVCGISNISLSTNGYYDCGSSEQHIETLTVTDNNGNSSSCRATVSIANLAPVALCKDITIQLEENGVVQISPPDIDNSSSSICGIAGVSLATGGYYDCGSSEVQTETLTITDNFGRSSSCTASVTISNILPVALCKDITVRIEEDGDVVITPADIDDGSSAVCGIANMSLSNGYYYCETLGTYTETLTITDAYGKRSSCTAMVSVDGAPIARCKDITVRIEEDGDTVITPEDINDGSSIPCFLDNMRLSNGYYYCEILGTFPEVLTITDAYGQTSSCTAMVTVDGTPIASCKDITVELEEDGDIVINPSDIDDGSSVPCFLDEMTLSIGYYNCEMLGANTETLTIMDNYGQSSTCTATVTLIDVTAPMALCKDVTIQLDENGQATTTADAINNDSSDACGIAGLSLDRNSFGCSDMGNNTVNLIVTDNNGNSASCMATVLVNDIEAPVILCPANIIVGNDSGICGAVINYDAVAVTDNCSVNLMQTAGLGSGATFPIGVTTENYLATDASGNQSSCSFTVTVNKVGDPYLLYAYTVIGFEEVKMNKNTVQSGGVGVVTPRGKAKFENGTIVTAANTFAKAPVLNLDNDSQVNTYYDGQVDESILPVFQSGSPCNNDIDIPDNSGSVTLDLDCYGKIEVGKNVSITFSGQAVVDIEEIDLEEGASVFFNQNTTLLIEKEFKGGEDMILSNGGHRVWIFAQKKVKIKRSSEVSCNIYTMDNLEVSKSKSLPTIMTGLFISAQKVDAKENVIWNWSPDCESNLLPVEIHLVDSENSTGEMINKQILDSGTSLKMKIYPNPFHSLATIRFSLPKAGLTSLNIFDLEGRFIQQLHNGPLEAGNHFQKWAGNGKSGSQLPSGVYLVRLRTREEVMNMKILLQ